MARGVHQVIDQLLLHARAPLNDFVAAVMELLVAARPAQGARPAASSE